MIAYYDDYDISSLKIMLKLEKIISGGQCGADIGALRAGLQLGLETGGTAPPGYQTSNGRNNELYSIYHLQELSQIGVRSIADGYVKRSMKNVDNSDGTIAFRTHSSPGTDNTITYSTTHMWKKPSKNITEGDQHTSYKPTLVITNLNNDANKLIIEWLQKHKIKILNVCGHRDHEFEQQVYDILINSLVNHISKNPRI